MQFSIKFPLVLVAAAAVVLSCSRESAYGDAGKNEDLPGVVGMCYDDGSSTSTALAVYWDPRPAMRRGAASFTIQLVRRLNESAGNVYDADFSRTFATSDSDTPGAVIFEGLETESRYYVRGRANYPGGRFSDWTYLYGEYSKDPAVVMVGTGIFDGPVTDATGAYSKLIRATESTLSFAFSSTEWEHISTDLKQSYNIELFRDEACTDLFVSWIIDPVATAGVFSMNFPPRFIFSGLESDTDYWFRVTDESDSENIMVSEPLKAHTEPSRVVVSGSGTVAAGEVALFEDFSELVYYGSILDGENAAGFNTASRGNLAGIYPATGVNPTTVNKQFVTGCGNEGRLFDTMQNPLKTTRLDTWGWCNENGVIGALCHRCAVLKLGNASYTASIVTPELSNLSGTATVEVSFKAQLVDPDNDQPHLLVEALDNATYNSTSREVTRDPAHTVSKPVEVEKKMEMKTYSVTLENVGPGTRIAIGGDPSLKAGKYIRVFVDDIQVKVVSYN